MTFLSTAHLLSDKDDQSCNHQRKQLWSFHSKSQPTHSRNSNTPRRRSFGVLRKKLNSDGVFRSNAMKLSSRLLPLSCIGVADINAGQARRTQRIADLKSERKARQHKITEVCSNHLFAELSSSLVAGKVWAEGPPILWGSEKIRSWVFDRGNGGGIGELLGGSRLMAPRNDTRNDRHTSRVSSSKLTSTMMASSTILNSRSPTLRHRTISDVVMCDFL